MLCPTQRSESGSLGSARALGHPCRALSRDRFLRTGRPPQRRAYALTTGKDRNKQAEVARGPSASGVDGGAAGSRTLVRYCLSRVFKYRRDLSDPNRAGASYCFTCPSFGSTTVLAGGRECGLLGALSRSLRPARSNASRRSTSFRNLLPPDCSARRFSRRFATPRLTLLGWGARPSDYFASARLLPRGY